MKIAYFSIALLVLAACNNQPQTPAAQPEAQKNNQPDSVVHCYQYANQGDTVSMKLVFAGDNIMGSLIYQLKDKDKNVGAITGVMRGDILVASYTFQSEGAQSVREVAFKKRDNTFTEGYGESVEQNGETKFKDINALNFGSSIVLQQQSCQ